MFSQFDTNRRVVRTRAGFAGLFMALLAAGCSRSTPAPVVWGDPSPGMAPAAQGVASTRSASPATARTAGLEAPVARAPVAVVSAAPLEDRGNAGTATYGTPAPAIGPSASRQTLAVSQPGADVHVVEPGDTFYSVARRYGQQPQQLAERNGLQLSQGLRVGQQLALADGGAPGDGAVNRAAPADPRPISAVAAGPQDSASTMSSVVRLQNDLERTAPQASPAGPVASLPEPAPRTDGHFAWPVEGRLISRYGAKSGGLFNDGINIQAKAGTPIRAAENGVVAYAGNELRGFGNLVLVRHADGWNTTYAHIDRIVVNRGDRVRKGQVLAYVGQTGNVDRPQLHFEIRQGTRAVDPLEQLAPGRQFAAVE